MTVGTTHTKHDFTGDGATVNFAVTFTLPATGGAALVKVYSDGVLKTEGTDYTIAVNADQVATPGATVTYLTAPASAVKVHIRRRHPRTQATAYTTNGTFPAASHAAALDKLTMLLQEREDADFFSAPQLVAASTILAVAHGLGLKPARVQLKLRCTSAELGYSVNDETDAVSGVGVVLDATNVTLLQDTAIKVGHKTTGAATAVTVASWRWIIEVWQ